MHRSEEGQLANGGTFSLASSDLEALDNREMWANEVESHILLPLPACHGGASTVLPNIKLDGSLAR